MSIGVEGRWESESFWLAVYNGKYINFLWFLKSLLVCYIFFPLLFPIIKNDNAKSGRCIYISALVLAVFGNNIATILLNVIKYFYDGSLFFDDSRTHNFIYPFLNDFRGGAFSHPVAYFIFGGIIYQKSFIVINQKLKRYMGAIIVFLCMFFLTAYGKMYQHAIGTYYNAPGSNYDCILVFLSVIGLYWMFQNIVIQNSLILRCIKLVGQNTLGIYLLHLPVGYFMRDSLITIPKNALRYSVLYSIAVLCISLLFTVIFKRIPLVRNLFKI